MTRCSIAAAARGDSMVATAPPAHRWLLIEHEGAWPANALEVFDPPVARALAARASAMHARISLVRRPGRHPREQAPLRWALADTRPGREGIRWGVVDQHHDLVDLDWDVTPGEGEPVAIVCAHSRHDVCCALRGRPVAAAMSHHWPGRVWECSHLGGDRFAATMVLLPHALCYGRVTEQAGARILTAFEAGRLVAEHLRGRSFFTRREQAAQALARAAGVGGEAIGDLSPRRSLLLGEDVAQVVLGRDEGDDLVVTLRERTVHLGTPATCRSTVDALAHEYDLVSVTPLEDVARA
ncbi:MAG: sucrase ferredoxin [Jiangellales bacterium]